MPEDRKIGSDSDHIFHLSGISRIERTVLNTVTSSQEIPDKREI